MLIAGSDDRRHAADGRRRDHVSGAAGRRRRRVPRLQLPAGVDLHGRQRQPAARLHAGGADAEPRRRPRQPVRRAVDHRRPGVRAADSDLRHDAGDAVARVLRAARPRAAAAITPRIGSSRSGCRSGRAVLVLWLLAAVGGVDRHHDPQRQRRRRRCWSARSSCVGDVHLRGLPVAHPRLRRHRRAGRTCATSRRSSSTSCTSGASSRCCSTSAWSASPTTAPTGCGSRATSIW